MDLVFKTSILICIVLQALNYLPMLTNPAKESQKEPCVYAIWIDLYCSTVITTVARVAYYKKT